MAEERGAGTEAPGVVEVPRAILESMPQLEEGVFRVAMYFCLVETVSREFPAVVAVETIALGTGLGVERVRRALRLLYRKTWVARTDDGRWCWARSIGDDPPESGSLGGESSGEPGSHVRREAAAEC